MKWISRLALFFIFVPIISSCGKKEEARVYGSPIEESRQPGVIASCTTQTEAENLAQSFKDQKVVQYRVLNKEKKLVEIYGLSEKEIYNSLPKAKLHANKFYKNLVGSVPVVSTYEEGHNFEHLNQIQKNLIDPSIDGTGVKIAIIDTGVSYIHPHLANNIFLNENESNNQELDQIDNDQNGFTDDYYGWNFVSDNAFPLDDHGHGTHVAGLAAGSEGGVAPKAQILAIKVLNSKGEGDLGSIAAGIIYAVKRGANIINLSLGGPNIPGIENELNKILQGVELARDNDVLIVAAAGNGGSDGIGDCNDANPIYPSGFPAENILAVAAVDAHNKITSYSNYGSNTVDVAAPGGSRETGGLKSTIPKRLNAQSQETYGSMIGTSMASPIVAGLAALIKSYKPELNFAQIKKIIMDSGNLLVGNDKPVLSKKIINVKNAIQLAEDF